jgi:hypothetical protein
VGVEIIGLTHDADTGGETDYPRGILARLALLRRRFDAQQDALASERRRVGILRAALVVKRRYRRRAVCDGQIALPLAVGAEETPPPAFRYQRRFPAPLHVSGEGFVYTLEQHND